MSVEHECVQGEVCTQDELSILAAAMPKVCHVCAKGPAFGHSRSHSMVATKRRFDPNLQRVRIDDGGTPRRVYVCTRCLKAGKVAKARWIQAGPDGPVSDPSIVRFRALIEAGLAELEARREEVNDLNVFPVADGDTGDNMVLTLRAVLQELDRLTDASEERTIDEIDRDEIVGLRRPRGPARCARQLRRDPLAADPRRGRGAGQSSRRAGRSGPDQRRAGPRRRPGLRLGPRSGRGDDPHRGARDGPPCRLRARSHAGRPPRPRDERRGAERGRRRGDRARARRRRGIGQARPRPAARAARGRRRRRRRLWAHRPAGRHHRRAARHRPAATRASRRRRASPTRSTPRAHTATARTSPSPAPTSRRAGS